MLLLAILLSAFLSCYGQEHLTCLRSSSPPAEPSVALRDVPGERVQAAPGKKGPIGKKGEVGAKGEKGDAGVPDDSLVQQLRGQISYLQEELQENSRSYIATAFRSGFVRLDGGWIGLFNGLRYKYITSRQTYSASRFTCRDMGASLAYQGIQDMGNRVILEKAFAAYSRIWIGLTKSSEGIWKWVDNIRATNATALWGPNQPDNKGGLSCGAMQYNGNFLSINTSCRRSYSALCEKIWDS